MRELIYYPNFFYAFLHTQTPLSSYETLQNKLIGNCKLELFFYFATDSLTTVVYDDCDDNNNKKDETMKRIIWQ